MRLCDNCLQPAVGADGRWMPRFPLGPARGTQRDPVRVEVDLCLACVECLGGPLGAEPTPVDLAAFHARHQHDKFVER